jgi:hypothetical protein
MTHKKITNQTLDAWDKLNDEQRVQHTLSNSELYRSVEMFKRTLREFDSVYEEYEARNSNLTK